MKISHIIKVIDLTTEPTPNSQRFQTPGLFSLKEHGKRINRTVGKFYASWVRFYIPIFPNSSKKGNKGGEKRHPSIIWSKGLGRWVRICRTIFSIPTSWVDKPFATYIICQWKSIEMWVEWLLLSTKATLWQIQCCILELQYGCVSDLSVVIGSITQFIPTKYSLDNQPIIKILFFYKEAIMWHMKTQSLKSKDA